MGLVLVTLSYLYVNISLLLLKKFIFSEGCPSSGVSVQVCSESKKKQSRWLASLPTNTSHVVVEPLSWSSNLYHGRRTHIMVVEPVTWPLNPCPTHQTRIAVVEPISPFWNPYPGHGTRITVIEPTSPLSNPSHRCRTRIVVTESLALSSALGIVVGPSRRGEVQGRVDGRDDLAGVSRYVGLGLEGVSRRGGRKEMEIRTDRASHFLGSPCVPPSHIHPPARARRGRSLLSQTFAIRLRLPTSLGKGEGQNPSLRHQTRLPVIEPISLSLSRLPTDAHPMRRGVRAWMGRWSLRESAHITYKVEGC